MRAAADLTFEELYRGHRADVYRAALRELGDADEAEDVTQAAFVDAYRAVLRGTRPQSPRAWLLAISENVRRRRFRTAQRRPREVPLEADFPLAAELPHEQAESLAAALAALPEEQRRVFVFRELAGLSYDEIAAETGTTVASVQMLLFRARRSLREQLDPPVVARRRTGVVVPVPGWLTGLSSRFELASLTPRAAGAVGATVLAVAGAGVAVTEPPADRPPSPATEHHQRAAPLVQSAPKVSRPVARATSSAATVATRSSARGAPASVSTPAAPAAGAPIPAAPALVPISAAPVVASVPTLAAPTLAQPSLPVSLRDEEVLGLIAEPVPGPLSTAAVTDLATGAVGAAGAGIPPLPAPSLPPVTLPPAP